MRRSAVLLSIASLALGCPAKEGAKEQTPEAKPAASATPTGDILAVVGDLKVTRAQFDAELEKLPAQHRQWAATPQGRRYILDNLLEGLLIESEAGRRGLDKKPEVVQRLESYRRQFLREALIKELVPESTVIADADAEKYFNEHPMEFKQPVRLKVLDLTVASEDTAKEVVAKLNKGGDFAALAKELSTDAFTRERGGDLPEFSHDMRPELFQAAEGKKAGAVVGPVKTQQGVHVMKTVKEIPPEEKSFEQVKEMLKNRLQAIKRQEAYSTFIKQAREAAKVTINEEFIKSAPPPAAAAEAAPAPK